jgi:hypothetical protein
MGDQAPEENTGVGKKTEAKPKPKTKNNKKQLESGKARVSHHFHATPALHLLVP